MLGTSLTFMVKHEYINANIYVPSRGIQPLAIVLSSQISKCIPYQSGNHGTEFFIH